MSKKAKIQEKGQFVKKKKNVQKIQEKEIVLVRILKRGRAVPGGDPLHEVKRKRRKRKIRERERDRGR